MAATMTRFNDVTPATFNNATINATESRAPLAKLSIVKDETSQQRSSCTYTNVEEMANEGDPNIDGVYVRVQPQNDSPTRSLSPEFLLGTPDKNGQKGNEMEGATDAVTRATCVYCNEAFPDKSAQDEHMATKHSTGKKVYDCSVCEKSFTHRSSRDIHLRVHTGLRPYECQFCKKRFRVSSHLRDHERTHTGERPFKCSECGRGFKQSSDMKKHRKTHFKSMPANSDSESATSYMIVRPEDTTTAVGEGPNSLRSPTDQRQNLKLVIKRERKSLDTKSSMSGDNKKTASDNSTPPVEKPSGDSTQYAELNEVITSNLESSSQWLPNSYETSMQAIRSTKEKTVSKSSLGKMTVKRKVGKGSNSGQKNGYKTNNSYPSMASGFGQIMTSTNENANQQVSSLTAPQNSGQTYNSDPQTDTSQVQQVQYDRYNLSHENRPTTQVENRNSEHDKNDSVFWQSESKRIKLEKLSPNSQEQPTHCHEQQAYGHEQPTYDHDASTYSDEQLIYGHESPTYYDEQPTGSHELATNGHEQPRNAYEQPTRSHELTSYTDHRLTQSEDAPMNIDNEQKYNNDEELTNGHVNSDPDMTSMNSVAKQRADDSAYTETQTSNTSHEPAEIDENNADNFPRNNDVAISNVTSKTEVNVRKPMVVKIRRDKIGASFSVRKPIKLKDQEGVKCSICEQTFSNLEEFTAHRCGKNGKTFRCNICNKTFARQTLLRQHMVLHQGSKRFRFKCNYCGRAFRHRSHLRDHERIHTGERPFKCSFCPKAFKQSSDHRKHENLHTGTTRYRCEKCSLDFKRCDALKRHAMMHTTGEVTLLKCEKCRSLFATADGHLSHFCLNKPYRYRCQVCPERFTDADDLRRHCYQLHSEQSTLSCLKCEFCKLEFQNLEELDEHLGTHCLEKTHRCRTCGQRFSLLNQLVEHVKTHVATPARTEDDPPVTNPTSHEPAEQTSSISPRSKDIPPNVMLTSNAAHISAKQTRPFYDFIPSRYQSFLHANSAYGELASGNWARPKNFYLPVRSKDTIDVDLRRQDEAPPISPRDNPTGSRTSTDVSSNNPLPSRSSTETYRGDTESYRRNAESSEIITIPSEGDAIAARSSTIANTVNANPQPSPNTNAFADEFSSTSFAAYHAIALSRSTNRRTELFRRQEPIAVRNEPTVARNEPTISRIEPTSSRDEPTINRPRTAYSMSNMVNRNEASPRPEVTARGGEVYRVHQPGSTGISRSEAGNPDIDFEEIRRYPEEIRMNPNETRRNPEEKRRNTEVIHLNSEELQSRPEQTRIDSEGFRRYPEGLRSNSEEIRTQSGDIRSNLDEIRVQSGGIRSNFRGVEMGPFYVQGNLTNGRDHTIISEEHLTDRRQRNGTTNMNRRETDSNFAKPQYEQTAVKRKYTCLNCRLEFYHESSLVSHVCDIISETLYSCLVCEQDFGSYEDLQVHMGKHWKPVVHFKCTLCGHRMRTEELLKEHNLKHLRDMRSDRSQSETTGDEGAYHRVTDGKHRNDNSDPAEPSITSPGSAKSVTSPVICSVSGNIVSKATRIGQPRSERGHRERRDSSIEPDASANPSTELTSPRQHDEVTPKSTHGSYVPYFEARKRAPSGYLNVFTQGPAIMMSTMHAAMETAAIETSTRYSVANGLLYPSNRARSGFTVEHH